jgi:HEAT repeat protein
MTRTLFVSLLTVVSTAFIANPPAQGTDLARRVASAPDGLVKMTYAARDGVCGDGRSFIAEATSAARGYEVWFLDGMSMSSVSGDIGARCASGPVRLLLVVRDRRVVAVQPFVGPSSPATERASTDLGTVAVADVSRYLLGLAAQGREEIGRNAILAATIADSVRIAQPLAAIATNKTLAPSVRESALRWVGRTAARDGDREAMRVPRTIAEDGDDRVEVRERAIRVIGDEPDGTVYLRSLYPRLDHLTLRERVVRVVGESGTRGDIDWIRGIALDRGERTAIRERAVRVIGEVSNARALRDLYNELDDATLRERVLRSVAEVGDTESRTWLRQIVERRTETEALRERAIRSLAEMGDLSYLRSAYRSLDDDGLRERILRSVVDGGGSETTAWLRDIARDAKERSALRERAVRSLAESGAATSELISLYDAVPDHVVRERLVTLLAERGDRAARDKLRAIASDDPSEDLRRRAVRKLAESR